MRQVLRDFKLSLRQVATYAITLKLRQPRRNDLKRSVVSLQYFKDATVSQEKQLRDAAITDYFAAEHENGSRYRVKCHEPRWNSG